MEKCHNPPITYTYEIKKSKFIGIIYQVDNVEQFKIIYELIKSEHKDAKQICYAYKINDNGIRIKAFNDTEPKGVASTTILSTMERHDVINLVVFVVRYFGGIKIGKSNLYRSYLHSAAKALDLYINKNKK